MPTALFTQAKPMAVTGSQHSLSLLRGLLPLSLLLGLFIGVVQVRAGSNQLPEVSNLYGPSALASGLVVMAGQGTTLMNHRSRANLVPGSIQKMFSAWFAFKTLGPSYTFSTSLFIKGSIKGQALKGDVIIKGGGDPAFCSRYFSSPVSSAEYQSRAVIDSASGFAGYFPDGNQTLNWPFLKWAGIIKEQGIRVIDGCIYGDGSLIPESQNPFALWEDVGNYYGGMPSGLCYRDNVYKIFFQGHSKPGMLTKYLFTEPAHTGLQGVQNMVKTGLPGSDDKAYIFGSFLGRNRLITGTFPSGRDTFSIKGSLPHPSWSCAQGFKGILVEKGIKVKESTQCATSQPTSSFSMGEGGSGAKLLDVHKSPQLKVLLKHTLTKSDNVYAEQLLAMAAYQRAGQGGQRERVEALRHWLTVQGLDTSQCHFKDGSGLSRYNWVSAEQVVQLLQNISRDKDFSLFRGLLLTGEKAASRLGLASEPFSKVLWVKTGFLEGVVTAAGFLQLESGEFACFCFMVNNSSDSASAIRQSFGTILRAIYKTQG